MNHYYCKKCDWTGSFDKERMMCPKCKKKSLEKKKDEVESTELSEFINFGYTTTGEIQVLSFYNDPGKLALLVHSIISGELDTTIAESAGREMSKEHFDEFCEAYNRIVNKKINNDQQSVNPPQQKQQVKKGGGPIIPPSELFNVRKQ